MTKKHYYSWKDIENACVNICIQMYNDSYRPDYIVGITRGGNVPATIISNMLDVPCETLKVSLRDSSSDCESNCWMAEEAFGYISSENQLVYKSRWDIYARKKILLVDDINDTGATFSWVMKDWQSLCMPKEVYAWDTVWGNTVKFATITENLSSNFDSVSYFHHEVNKAEEDVWLCYPWETVGK